MKKQYDLMTFGEAMVRFTAPEYMRLEQSNALNLAITGAELSVAVNNAKLGLKTAWVSKLVDTWSGKYMLDKARGQGVDLSNCIWVPYDGTGRVRNALSFIEVGIGPRASRMLYDRGHSAISMVDQDEFDWDALMDKTGWFHTTGITTALSDALVDQVIKAFKAANKKGVTVSFDLNFRSTLWDSAKAQTVLKDVIPYVNVLIGNEEDFEKCLGIKAEGTTENFSKISPKSYEKVARKAMEMYPGVKIVATTLRDARTGLLNDWQAAMVYGERFYISKKYEGLEIVDRIGGGDSFASALIYCFTGEKHPQEIIDFSAAYSALCHGFMGDWNWATKQEAESAMKGGSARVKR